MTDIYGCLPDELFVLDPKTIVTALRFIADHQPSSDQIEDWATAAETAWNERVAKEDATEVVVEVDLGGRRINVRCEDANGSGHGYRLHGPKFNDVDGGKVTACHVLDKRDVEELRIYLRIWDRIQDRKAAVSAASKED